MPRSDPRSYRFQVRTLTRLDDGTNEYGIVPVWSESDLRVEGIANLSHRIRLAYDAAERLARKLNLSVVVCIQPLDGSQFTAELAVHHSEDGLALRLGALRTVEPASLGTSRHIYE